MLCCSTRFHEIVEDWVITQVPLKMKLDHLVFACSDLKQADEYCIRHFKVRPVAGGKHLFMGTHNSLLKLSHTVLDLLYIEFIAIDPSSTFASMPEKRRRWFDLDDENLQKDLQKLGPKLIHYVVSVDDEAKDLSSLKLELEQDLGVDSLGDILQGSRKSPTNEMLTWSIVVRNDGSLMHEGKFPTLISWRQKSQATISAPHPAQSLPDVGLRLDYFQVMDPFLRSIFDSSHRLVSGVEFVSYGDRLSSLSHEAIPRFRLRVILEDFDDARACDIEQ